MRVESTCVPDKPVHPHLDHLPKSEKQSYGAGRLIAKNINAHCIKAN